MVLSNAKVNDVYFNNFGFQNNIWNFFKLFKTALIKASGRGHTETVKILVEQLNKYFCFNFFQKCDNQYFDYISLF